MKRLATWASLSLLSLLGLLANPLPIQAQCGGTERWAVKVGTDSGASNVDLTNQVSINLTDLIGLPEPHRPPAGDNNTRLSAEMHVYVVRGHLVKFKFETDSDYHMVISDDTLAFTDSHAGRPPGHSFIAEIPDPNCIAGAHGNPSAQSLFINGIRNARGELEAQFPNIDTSGTFNDAGGIPVQIVGIGFFDFPHGQVGRASNNIEIHPVLDIAFNPSQGGSFTLSASPAQLSIPQGGSASTAITTSAAGGLNAAITLSVAGTPPNGNATFNPSSIPAPGSGSSTLSVSADPSTPTGNYSLTVSGNGGGGMQTATVALTVTPAAPPPSTTVTAPTDGATVSGMVNVNAVPSSSGAVKLEIYIDGALKACNFGAASISYPWDTTAAANGAHTLVSKAYNAAGAVGSSSTVSVTVSN